MMTRGYWSLRFSAFLNWSLRFSAFLIDCLVVLLAGVCVCACVCARRGTVEALHLCCSSKKDQHRAISEHAIKVALGRSGQARSGQVRSLTLLCSAVCALLCSAVLCVCRLRAHSYNTTEPWPSAAPEAFVFGEGGAHVSARAWSMGCGWEGTESRGESGELAR